MIRKTLFGIGVPCGATFAAALMLGVSLVGNQAKAALLKEIAPAIVRFPGSSQANFYDWKTGLLDFHGNRQSSRYVRFWAQIAPKIARTFPDGVHLEDYMPFAREVGADVILVPNLETSTLESSDRLVQAAGQPGHPAQKHRARERVPDRHGKRSRQSATLAGRAQRDGGDPSLRAGAASDSRPRGQGTGGAPPERLGRALRSENWFEAVTIHLYLLLKPLQRLPGGDTHDGLFRYLMARCNGGVDRTIKSVSARVLGKEIWIT